LVDAIIRKTTGLNGEVTAPPSKAYTQRMLIACALANGTSEIVDPLVSEDTKATARAVTALGAKIEQANSKWSVKGPKNLTGATKPIDCGESGATLRFMIPIAALAAGPSSFLIGKSLEQRPIQPLLQSLFQIGALAQLEKKNNKMLVQVQGGGIPGGRTVIPGNISSQFISGLMFACPKAQKATEIILATPLESGSYVRMTEATLAQHQVSLTIQQNFQRITIPPNQTYQPRNHKVPGDFSSAAFLLAAATVTNSSITVKNLDSTIIQGDKAITDTLQQIGSNLTVSTNQIQTHQHKGQIKPLNIDARDTPDLVPIYAVLACFAKGISKIHNAHRLRFKESDRLRSIYLELKKMGADIDATEDSLTIRGPTVLHGASIDPHNDHRIAMALAVAALGAEGETVIKDSECVKKSYPEFFDALRSLGVDVFGGKFDR
jgi:3-phosphoshikimate 1-carboxyvinyltransferase